MKILFGMINFVKEFRYKIINGLEKDVFFV